MLSLSLSYRFGVLFATILVKVDAHRAVPNGITCGPQFSSPDTPLIIPNPRISWANYGIYTCEHPVTWFEATADANQELEFTITVPEIDRFVDTRMAIVVIGPGLPQLTPEANPDVLDSIIQYASDSGLGGEVYTSPSNQSTCDHLISSNMIDATTVKNEHCHFYEPFSSSNMWVVLDELLAAPESGTYMIAVYEQNGSTAKASFACCAFPEDFLTAYDIPESTCPACGTDSSNPAWSSLYYEHKTMEDYGGFPVLEDCKASADVSTEYPSGDMCPSPDVTDDDVQQERCALGCSSQGECHSHDVFGDCTYLLDWNIDSFFGGASVDSVTIYKGEKIRFKAPAIMPHTLIKMTDEESLNQCNFAGSANIANVGEIFLGYDYVFDEAGIFYFSCDIGSHCNAGQKLTVEVKDATEGLRCHSHDHSHNHNSESEDDGGPNTLLECENGNVNARAVNNVDYGTMNANECAEFCTSSSALVFMTGVEQGSCNELDFKYNTETKIVLPPNSPMDLEVIVVSSVDAPHCHSYEKIACPKEGNRENQLYVEHIQEITEYCTGVLNESEEDCPYKCFQPMEVLHLHYLECPSRAQDPLYIQIEATEKCHVGVTPPDSFENPASGDSDSSSTSSGLFSADTPSKFSDDSASSTISILGLKVMLIASLSTVYTML